MLLIYQREVLTGDYEAEKGRYGSGRSSRRLGNHHHEDWQQQRLPLSAICLGHLSLHNTKNPFERTKGQET